MGNAVKPHGIGHFGNVAAVWGLELCRTFLPYLADEYPGGKSGKGFQLEGLVPSAMQSTESREKKSGEPVPLLL